MKMNSQIRLKSISFLFAFLFLNIACQEIPVNEEIDQADEDMITANQLAKGYLNTTGARIGSEISLTVLKFQEGKLLFGTDSDIFSGYEEINEETVTATVERGEYVFWYGGGGLSDLDGIVFDEESQLQLVDAPEEIFSGKMWVLTIPEDFDEEDGILKYDIVYDFPGNSGPPIRLDPKLKIQDAE